MTQIQQEQLFTYTCTLLCAELMVNYMEELKGTLFYKHGIKSSSTRLESEIESLLKTELPKIYAANETYVVNCMTHLKELVDSISELNSSEIIEYTQILREFKKDKDMFLDKHQLVLKKLDE